MAKQTPPTLRTPEEQAEWLKKAQSLTAEQQAARLKAEEKLLGKAGDAAHAEDSPIAWESGLPAQPGTGGATRDVAGPPSAAESSRHTGSAEKVGAGGTAPVGQALRPEGAQSTALHGSRSTGTHAASLDDASSLPASAPAASVAGATASAGSVAAPAGRLASADSLAGAGSGVASVAGTGASGGAGHTTAAAGGGASASVAASATGTGAGTSTGAGTTVPATATSSTSTGSGSSVGSGTGTGAGTGTGSSAGAGAGTPASQPLALNGDIAGTTVEDGVTTATGKLTASGGVPGAMHWSLGNSAGHYGSLAIDPDGTWHYTLDNAHPTVQALQAGQQVGDKFMVVVTDSSGAARVAEVAVKVTGSNDLPTVTDLGVHQVTEDLSPHCSGKLDITDTDTGEAHFQAGDIVGQYGTLHLASDGAWTYDLDSTASQKLGAGETPSEMLTVLAADGTPHIVTVAIAGTNDAPVMGLIPPMATFEGSAIIRGHLMGIDLDAHDTLTYRATAPIAGFTLNADGSYSFDPADPAYEHLGFQQHQIINIPVEVVDSAGATASRTIQLTITGTNDAPTLNVLPPRNVAEGGAVVSGQLTATDTDDGATLSYSLGQTVPGFTLHADGSYRFDPADPHYNAIPAGQKAILTVPVIVTDEHGGHGNGQIQITVTGTNDVPMVGGIDHAVGSITGAQGHTLSMSGSLAVIDLDQGESHFQAQLLKGSYGVLQIGEDGHWSYVADTTQAALNQLPANGHVDEHFTVMTADGTTHSIDLQLKGSKAPAIFAGTSSGMVQEDQSGVIRHHLDVMDPNAGEAAVQPLDQATHYGHFTIAANGDWSYQLDNANPDVQALIAGKTLTDSILVGSVDGTPKMITLTILGTNDVAVISGTHAGDVIEDNTGTGTTLTADGQLTVTDPDASQDHFIAMQGIAGDHGYGTFSVDAQGHWTYTADNSLPAIQALKDGATATDSFTVMTADGTKQIVTVTLTGTNDAAVITGTDTGSVTEDINVSVAGKLQANGKLSITDADTGEAQFIMQSHVSGSGGYGAFLVMPSGAWIYSADPNNPAIQALKAGETRTDTLTVTSTDGTTHTITVTLTGTNDAPTVTAVDAAHAANMGSLFAGTSQTFTQAQLLALVHAADVDHGDTLSISAVAVDPALGSFTRAANGDWTFHAAAGAHGSQLPVTLTISDGTATTTAVGAIEVKSVLTGDLSGQAVEDTTTTITGNLHDGSGATLHLGDHLMHGTFGSLDLRDQGHWSYALDNANPAVQGIKDGETRTETFTITGPGGQPQDITITITGTHDQPVISVPSAASQTIGGVTVMHDLDGADVHLLDSAFATSHTGVPVGTHIVGLYLPGDSHNLLANIAPGDLPTVHEAYNTGNLAAAGAGYQFLNQHQWFGQHLDGGAVRYAPVAPSIRNNFDGGIVVFSDGNVGRLVKVCDDDRANGPGDYLYFNKFDGVNAQQGLTALTGSGTAGSQVEVFEGSTSLGHATVDAQGHWTFVLPHALADGDHALHTVSGGVSSAVVHAVVQQGAVTLTQDAPALGTATEDDAAHSSLTGQMSVTDIDVGDHPVFTAQSATAGTYGSFSVDAQGHWTYTLDNSNPQVQALGANDHRTETFTVEVTTDSGEHVTQSVQVTVAGSNDAPTLTTTTAHPIDLGTLAEDTAAGKTFTQADLLRLTGASDGDAGDTLSISAISVDTQYGTMTRLSNGDWKFTPAANAHHDDIPLTISVSDGHATTTAQARLDVTPVTDVASPTMIITADQQVIALGATGTGAVVQSDTMHTGGPMHGLTIDMTILGGQQVQTQGIHGATLISYGTPSDPNHLYIWKPEDLTFRVGGQEYTTGVPLRMDGRDHRYTFVWNSDHGTLDVLIDGHLEAHRTGVGQGATIGDGGKFVLGQDQDSFGGGFQTNDAYKGTFFDVAIAKEAVDPQQLAGTPLRDLLQGSPNLLTHMQAQGSGIVDTTGHYHYSVQGDFHVNTVQVDTAVAPPRPGTTLHLQITSGAPADHDDTVVATRLSGFSPGTVVTDGTSGHSATVSGPGQVVDVSGWQMSSLSARLPPGSNANMNLQLEVVTRGPDGSEAQAHAAVPVVLDPTQPVPDAVIHGDDTKTTDEDSAVSGILTITDADASQQHFTAQTDTDGQYGKFSIGTNGHWTYTPDDRADALAAGATQKDSFTVTSADGTAHQVVISLTGTNDAPTITAFTGHEAALGATLEDTTKTFTEADLLHLVGAADVDSGQTLHISAVTIDPAAGSFTHQANGDWAFTPAANFNGAHLPVTLTVTDGTDTTAAHGSLDVTPVNDAPTATAQTQTATEDGAVLHGRFTATDIDGDTLSYSTTAQVDGFTLNADGSYSFDPGHASYQHLAAGQTQPVDILITVSDGHGGTTTQNLQITLTGTDDVPTVIDMGSHVADLARANLEAAGMVRATDVDSAAPHIVEQTGTQGRFGQLSVNAQGIWRFQLDPALPASQALASGQTDHDTFTVRFSDGATHDIVIDVRGTNQGPQVANNVVDLGAGAYDQPQTFTEAQLLSLFGATNPGGGPLSVSDVHIDAQYGSFAHNPDGSWTFTPAHGVSGNDIPLTISVTDGTATTTGVGVIDIALPPNTAPTVTADASHVADLGATAEDTAKTFTDADLLRLVGAADSDAGNVLHVGAVTVDPQYGSFTKDAATGDWTFTPAANVNGNQVPLTISVTDGRDTTDAHAKLAVTAVDDALTVTADMASPAPMPDIDVNTETTFTKAQLLQLVGATDPDGDALSISEIHIDPKAGYFAPQANGDWVFKPAANFHADDLDITLKVSDGTSTVEAHAQLDIKATPGQLAITTVDNALKAGSSYETASANLAIHGTAVGLPDGTPITVHLADQNHPENTFDLHTTVTGGAWSIAFDQNKVLVDGNHDWAVTARATDLFGTAVDATTEVVYQDTPTTAAQRGTATTSLDLLAGSVAGTVVQHVQYSTDGQHWSDQVPAGFTLAADGHTLQVDPTHTAYSTLGHSQQQQVQVRYELAQASDPSATIHQTASVTITGSNHGPTVSAVDAGHAGNLGATAEDTAKTFSEADLIRLVGGADADHDTLHVTAVHISPEAGSFARDASGSWTFTPAANYDGSHLPVTVDITDGTATATGHAQIAITPVADTPVLGISLGAIHLSPAVVLAKEVTNPSAGGAYGSTVDADLGPSMIGGGIRLIAGDAAYVGDLKEIILNGHHYAVASIDGSAAVLDTGLPGDKSATAAFIKAGDYRTPLTFVFKDGAAHTPSTTWQLEYFDRPGEGDNQFVNGMANWDSALRIDRVGGATAADSHFTAHIPEDFGVELHITLSDPDSSEHLALMVSGLPQGATLSAGTHNADGTWSLTPDQLPGLTMTPPPDFSGDIHMEVTATSTDHAITAQKVMRFDLTVDPVAELPSLSVAALSAAQTQLLEDSAATHAIALDLHVSTLHVDPSEVLSVHIDGLPTGASLSAGIVQPDGSWSVPADQLPGLSLNLPGNFVGNWHLNVRGVSTDGGTTAQTVAYHLAGNVAPVLDMSVTYDSAATISSADALATGIPLPIHISAFTDPGESIRFAYVELPAGWQLQIGGHTWQATEQWGEWGQSQVDGHVVEVPIAVHAVDANHHRIYFNVGEWGSIQNHFADAHLIPPAGFQGGDVPFRMVADIFEAGVNLRSLDIPITLHVQDSPAPAPAPDPALADYLQYADTSQEVGASGTADSSSSAVNDYLAAAGIDPADANGATSPDLPPTEVLIDDAAAGSTAPEADTTTADDALAVPVDPLDPPQEDPQHHGV